MSMKFVKTVWICAALALPAVASAKQGDWDVSAGIAAVIPDITSPVVNADASTQGVPIVNISYFLTNEIALGTAVGVTCHAFNSDGFGGYLGRACMAPFHLMGQYHFARETQFSPYLGIGIHHTVFYDQEGPVFDMLEDFKSDTGLVLEAGLNFKMSNGFFVQFDVKKFFLETDVVPSGATAAVETIELDPYLISLTIGKRF